MVLGSDSDSDQNDYLIHSLIRIQDGSGSLNIWKMDPHLDFYLIIEGMTYKFQILAVYESKKIMLYTECIPIKKIK